MQRLLTQFIRLASERNDVFLATILILIVFMMILPLPTLVIDILIACNMSAAAILLMVSMYLPAPVAFSSFPSVLLVTTLFRLGISIATTRMILLEGDAGSIIDTFGNFVVGGNLVVGLVVFLILTIVQFIVITKGAERVAEVAARFSLDAMPGKQMSIDGDMRAGAINMEEAKKRRNLVEKESQLYGAMDGAMKFVKGDAIAGLIIVGVNLIGGMIIGVLMRDLSIGEAVQQYSILSVGDGLVSQIPALFISICAGMIVTRVATDDSGTSNVANDIGAQIGAQPRALMIGAIIMVGLAAIPGMPWGVFLFLAVIFALIGWSLSRTAKDNTALANANLSDPTKARKSPGGKGSGDDFLPTVPLILEVAKDLERNFSSEKLNAELAIIKSAIYHDLGVPFPGIHMRYNNTLDPQTYSILLNEVPVSKGYLKPNSMIVRETPRTLETLSIPFETTETFLIGIPAIWANESLENHLTQAGISCMKMNHILTYHLGLILKKNAFDFIGIQETKTMLTTMEGKFPDLVKELIRVMPIQKISEILQRLVSEEISIRNLRTVLEALIEWGQKEKDSVILTEYVRTALKRQISFKYSRQGTLPAYLFSPNVEDMIRNAIRQTSAGSYLSLDAQSTKRLVTTIKKTVGDLSVMVHKPVLITSMDIRRYVRKMIEQDMYELSVLSYQELTPEVNIQPLGRVEI